jgi:hypothetical protein
MAKHDWVQLQKEFLIDHERTHINAKEWCEKKGLNYSSARRYIKSTHTQAKIKLKNKAKEQPKTLVETKAKLKNTGTLKHGGYSKYFNTDITKLVSGTDLTDELELCRSRIHLVICTIEEIQRRLSSKEDKPSTEVASSLFESLLKADIALDRNIARVESITKTLSSIRIDDLNEYKISADTKRSVEVTKATVINAKKSIAQTELVELQVKQARKEAGGTSKIDEYIDKKVNSNVVDTVIS